MAYLNFKGKPFVQNYHMLVKYCQLIPRKEKSLTKEVSLKDNLIIHGDNLAALKALMPQYAGKVKCIYIDPPYNTGNEGWAYNDNVTSPMMQEWLGKVVDRDDLTRHDKWLCMMMPRLKLLRELLREDGVVFVSIDDNEVHHLRMLMDEVFGEENFVALLPAIMNLKGNQDQFAFAGTHEYVLVFSNKRDSLKIGHFELGEEEQEEWLEDEVGPYKKGANLKATGGNAPKEKRQNLFFPLFVSKEDIISTERKDKSDVEIWPVTDKRDMSWRWGKKKVSTETYNLIVIREGNEISIYKKQRPSIGDIPSKKPKSVLYKPEYSSGNGTSEIKVIFGEKIFNNPKPSHLIKDLIQIGGGQDAIVLDSFAGSGTTGHAVLSLNKEDGGKRKFILIQCDEKRNDKTSGICDAITAERVRRVITGVPKAKDENLRKGLGGSFSYFDLGEPIDVERLLTGKGGLPSYRDLARYLFYTATGESFDEKALDPDKNFVGESKTHAVYLFYVPNLEKLKNLALNLNDARRLKCPKDKRLLVFAPTKYLDQEYLEQYKIDFVQLPYEIYKAFG